MSNLDAVVQNHKYTEVNGHVINSKVKQIIKIKGYTKAAYGQ